MPTLLPIDQNNNAIPAMRFKAGGAHAIETGSDSQNNAVAFASDTRIISLYATKAVYIKFGSDSVAATDADHFFPAGVYYDVAIGGGDLPHYTHVAALCVSEDGVLYISEKE